MVTVTIKEVAIAGSLSTILEGTSTVSLTAVPQVNLSGIFNAGGVVYVSATTTAVSGANYGSDTGSTTTNGIAEAMASGASRVVLLCDGTYTMTGTLVPTSGNLIVEAAMVGSMRYGSALVAPAAKLNYTGSSSAMTLSGTAVAGLRFRGIDFTSNASQPTVHITNGSYGNIFYDCWFENDNAIGGALAIDGQTKQSNRNIFEECLALGGAQAVTTNGAVGAVVVCGGLANGESTCNGNRFKRFSVKVNPSAADGTWMISSNQGDWQFDGLNMIGQAAQTRLLGALVNGTGPYVFTQGLGSTNQNAGSSGGATGDVLIQDAGGSGLVVVEKANLGGGNFMIGNMNWVFRNNVPSGSSTFLNISGGQCDYDNTNDDFQSKLNVAQSGGVAIWTDRATPNTGSARFTHTGGTRYLYSSTSV